MNLGLPDNWAVNCLQCTGFAFSAASLLLGSRAASAQRPCPARRHALLLTLIEVGNHILAPSEVFDWLPRVVLSVPAYPFDLVLRYAALRDALPP